VLVRANGDDALLRLRYAPAIAANRLCTVLTLVNISLHAPS
jgi:hypothetical protein